MSTIVVIKLDFRGSDCQRSDPLPFFVPHFLEYFCFSILQSGFLQRHFLDNITSRKQILAKKQ